jgi:Uma2 family endonuclease
MLKIAPHLAVEVLSPHNTKAEMNRKLVEYFDRGVQLVWYVDPRTRTVAVYTSPRRPKTLSESQTLDGGTVLPGFSVPVAQIFAELEPTE